MLPPRISLLGLLGLTLLLSGSAYAQEKPTADAILARIRPDHPRLLATANDFAALRSLVGDPKVAPTFAAVRANADGLLSQPPHKYELRDGVRLLFVSREVRDVTLALGLTYRLTGDKRYADRLWKEMDAVTRFPDWHPPHFLDTAEMTFAVAIAYDWLYEVWTPAQRRQMSDAILKFGLQPGLDLYRAKKGFATRTNNWNQVCNGGMIGGAVAVAKDQPVAAGEVLKAAVASLPKAMKNFAPDGAWSEGPGYWQYATEYNCLALGALRSATGGDFGLSDMPGFSQTGDVPLTFTGPLGLTFNFADAQPSFGGAAQLFWFATAFKTPAYAAFQLPYARANPSPLNLLWGAAWLAREPKLADRPLDRRFLADQVVYLRSAWADPKALFVGFKGGVNGESHAQLDLGSFVFDAAGQRWALDAGPDDYNRPAYFGASRWTYYRCRAEGNNCFVLNPSAEPDQSPKAVAKVVSFHSDAVRAHAVVDLSQAYASAARSALRGVAMLDRRRLLIQDEVQTDHPVDYWWFMHTDAAIEIGPDGRTATLRKGNETLTATLATPGAKFSVMPAASLPSSPPPPDAGSDAAKRSTAALQNIRKLTIHVSAKNDLTVAVLLEPGTPAKTSFKLMKLSDWQ